jgi:hypothetical protein
MSRKQVVGLAIAHNGNLSNGRMFPSSSRSPASQSIASMPRDVHCASESTRLRKSGDGKRAPFVSE